MINEELKNDIINLNDQVLQLREQIRLKENELNLLKLQEETNHIIKFYIDNMNKKKILKAVKMLKDFFIIKFNIKKFLMYVKKAEYFNIQGNDCIWKIVVDKYGIEIYFMGALIDKEVKDILTKVMIVIKEINKDKICLGVTGIKGLSVPEIENGEFKIFKLR